jgi:hypothetical protein
MPTALSQRGKWLSAFKQQRPDLNLSEKLLQICKDWSVEFGPNKAKAGLLRKISKRTKYQFGFMKKLLIISLLSIASTIAAFSDPQKEAPAFTPQGPPNCILTNGLGQIDETYRGQHKYFGDDVIGNFFDRAGAAISKWAQEIMNGAKADETEKKAQ